MGPNYAFEPTPDCSAAFSVRRRRGAAHYGHNVAESEVEEVLGAPGEDRPGREGSRVAIGRTSAGRLLRVIYVPDSEPDSAFVITAYEVTGKPALAYRRRRRKKR